MKWLAVCVLLGVYSQDMTASGFTVSVFSATSKTMILRWTKVPGATSYRIGVAPHGSPGSPIAFAQFGPNTVMGSINSLSPNVDYVFTVEALDNSSPPMSLHSSSVESPTAPAMMDPIHTVKPKDSRTLMVEFSPQGGASSYIVRVQNNNGFYREDTVFNSPAEIQSLQPYTEYQLTVMGQNTGGRSQPSSSVNAKTVLPAPQLSASSPCNGSIIVSWPPVAHAVHYTLSLTKFGTSTNMKYNTTETNMTIADLDAGALYIIGGYAWDPEGRKGDSSVYINQTTRPPTPSGVNITVAMNDSVAQLLVSWEVDPDLFGPVDYSVTSDRGLGCNSSSAPSCVLSPVSCGEAHAIRVTAANQAGPGYPFGPALFITIPCPPDSLALVEPSEGNCTLSWNTVPYADGYNAFIKRGDGVEEIHNTTGSNSTFHCQCGHTYLMSVRAFNQAGTSPKGESFNYTTLPCCPEGVSVSAVSTDTLEITWTAARGAELYETRAADGSEVVLCNDTAPVCALSDLSCDSAYSVVVTPCNDISGCNRGCPAHTKNTAPCMPTNVVLDVRNSSSVGVSWTGNNGAANYTVRAVGDEGTYTCSATSATGCDITDLPCGCSFDVSVTAHNAAGWSLPSYSETMETEPCCPVNLTVAQVTQAMTNVSWSAAKGAHSFLTSLTSPRGHARCHTQDSHCLMGCITCGTSYTVTMEAFSHSGRKANCTYQGFSSSACCPSGVRLYKLGDSSMRVYWRSSGGSHSHEVELLGSSNTYNCSASAGENSCDVANIQCGDTYHVVVAPLTAGGSRVQFCAQRMYSVICQDNNIGTVVYRGKRSVD